MEPTASAAPDLDALNLPAHAVLRPVRGHAMFLIDLQGRIRSWNEGVGHILGWPEAQWLGESFHLVFPPEAIAAGVPEAEMRQAGEQGHAGDERWMLRHGGERFYAAGSLERLVDTQGRPVGYLKVLRDFSDVERAERAHQRRVTEQSDAHALASRQAAAFTAAIEATAEQLQQRDSDLVQAESVLLERNQELRALVDGIRDYAIFTITPDGRIASWHHGAMLMKGYTPSEAIGMRFELLFTPEQRASGRPDQEMAAAARDGEFKGEGIRLRKDGSTFEAAVVLTALRGAEGELLGFLKLTQDITERRGQQRQLEQALHDAHRARAEAESANHTKGEFLATISHELRTPLSAILGWAHLLERGSSDIAMLAKGLSAISRNARVQAQLIEDLLDMNRIESGQLRLDLQHVDLGALVLATVVSMLPGANAKNIALRSEVDDSLGLVVGDPGRLQQVVGNLLGNAIKFTPPGGHVMVRLGPAPEGVSIVVEDDGQGIEADFLPRVYDRFLQQDATTTRRHGGLGIGLAVVRHLVQLHGGSVRAESAGAGRGAHFTVLLPREGPAAMAMVSPPRVGAAAEPPPSQRRLDGTAVLIVDDEPDLRAMTEQVLREAGARVQTAGSAEEAIDALQQARPDVILCDIGMPVHDGYEFLRRARQLPGGADIPAAAFTAYARPEDRQRSHEAGFRMHLTKPVLPSVLVDAVAELVRAD